jgi:FKBP-type peptidyl-prolyl cis-trans isomerase FklB
MKQITTALLAIVILLAGAVEAQAQKKGKTKKGETKVDTMGLSYNYGLLLGMSLQMQGISADSIKSAEVLAGMEKALKNKLDNTTMEKAQEIFTQKMEAAQKSAESASVEKEKSWFDDNAKKNKNVKTLPSGVQYEVLKEGNGEKPTPTSKVTTHYHGTLTNGTVFDSSVDRGEPATFPVNGVIKGWQEILPLMPTGSKWKVYIPSALAYGSRAVGNIPPNSILVFEIELLSIEKK